MDLTSGLEILKYILPSLVVLLASLFTLRSFLDSEYKRRELEFRVQHYKDSLPIRLQAYERLTLFLERISPSNIISRTNKPDMYARDLQIALIQTIRSEYEHNLSQQIYVSSEVWQLIVNTKEEIVGIVNSASVGLPETALGKDLGRRILEYFINNDKAIPTQKALEALKAEVRKIY